MNKITSILEFSNTKRYINNLYNNNISAYLYINNLEILLIDENKYILILEDRELESSNISELEYILYNYYISEYTNSLIF